MSKTFSETNSANETLVLGAEGTENYFACDLGVGERLFELFNVLVHGRQWVIEVAFVNNGASTHALSVPDTHTHVYTFTFIQIHARSTERKTIWWNALACVFLSHPCRLNNDPVPITTRSDSQE